MQANSDNFPAREAFLEGRELLERGDLSGAITALRRSVLLFADMDTPRRKYLFIPTLREERARACELCADCLAEAGQRPEAANLYQEAVDVYQSLRHSEKATECAHKAVEVINSMRLHPEERLQLLIARHERKRQQLTLHTNTEEERARISMEIGQICVRRERYAQAKESYEEAVRLLLSVEAPSLSLLYIRGQCYHQLGNLALYRFHDLSGAETFYRSALVDLRPCNTLDEYDNATADMCVFALQDIAATRRGVSTGLFGREERE